MTDTAALDALLAPARWELTRCRVAQALERLDPKILPKVETAVADPLVPASNIATAFHQLLGDTVPAVTIRRHRARTCLCP